MSIKKKVLFICFADSPHSQSWIDLIDPLEFEVRVFAYPAAFGDQYPPIPWSQPTYTIEYPHKKRISNKVYYLFPNIRWVIFLSNLLFKYRLPISRRWLRLIIKQWKPDIIHSLSFRMGGFLTYDVFEKIQKQNRPKWVISSWGTEINFGIKEDQSKKKISACLQDCDWFISDCQRDIDNAKSLGLSQEKLAWEFPIPGAGGIDLDKVKKYKKDIKDRNLIIIPKAYESTTNKTLPILEAVKINEQLLDNYKIFLLMTSQEVKNYATNFLPNNLLSKIIFLPTIPKDEFFELLGKARMMIAPSISDGTPNVMLEAMALGAIPIMSPISSIQEWITDGENGFLPHALFPNEIALAIKQAISNDHFFINANIKNFEIISKRANKSIVREKINLFYKNI